MRRTAICFYTRLYAQRWRRDVDTVILVSINVQEKAAMYSTAIQFLASCLDCDIL